MLTKLHLLAFFFLSYAPTIDHTAVSISDSKTLASLATTSLLTTSPITSSTESKEELIDLSETLESSPNTEQTALEMYSNCAVSEDLSDSDDSTCSDITTQAIIDPNQPLLPFLAENILDPVIKNEKVLNFFLPFISLSIVSNLLICSGILVGILHTKSGLPCHNGVFQSIMHTIADSRNNTLDHPDLWIVLNHPNMTKIKQSPYSSSVCYHDALTNLWLYMEHKGKNQYAYSYSGMPTDGLLHTLGVNFLTANILTHSIFLTCLTIFYIINTPDLKNKMLFVLNKWKNFMNFMIGNLLVPMKPISIAHNRFQQIVNKYRFTRIYFNVSYYLIISLYIFAYIAQHIKYSPSIEITSSSTNEIKHSPKMFYINCDPDNDNWDPKPINNCTYNATNTTNICAFYCNETLPMPFSLLMPYWEFIKRLFFTPAQAHEKAWNNWMHHANSAFNPKYKAEVESLIREISDTLKRLAT